MAQIRRGITQDLKPFVEDGIGLDALAVYFQPIVNLANGEVFAYEALARPTGANVKNPMQLFEVAIERDICGELGRLLRVLAVDGCRDWPLFLNVHPRELDDGWLTRPDDPLFRHEQDVFLEITESVPMKYEEHRRGTLLELRGKGINLVVDDLGAGYSNLKYIADLNPEIVKIDRELVANLTVNSRLFRLVSAVVRLCTDLDARVVAEGIETVEELEAVKAAGAHYGQGYLLGRPAKDVASKALVKTSLPPFPRSGPMQKLPIVIP
ncbi:MAG: EAL domain-containing protein [Myxococcota bacterium]